jgi:hypothetical protein
VLVPNIAVQIWVIRGERDDRRLKLTEVKDRLQACLPAGTAEICGGTDLAYYYVITSARDNASLPDFNSWMFSVRFKVVSYYLLMTAKPTKTIDLQFRRSCYTPAHEQQRSTHHSTNSMDRIATQRSV